MSSEILNKKSIFEPHRASQVKRAAAYLIDLILFLVVFTGVLYLVSIIIGFQDSLDKLNAMMEQYQVCEDENNPVCIQNWENFNKDSTAVYYSNKTIELLLIVFSVSVIVTNILYELIIPLCLKNGQTVGLKVFNLGFIDNEGVKVRPIQVFVRFLFGKTIVNILIPFYSFLFYTMYGGLPGMIAGLLAFGIPVMNILLFLFGPKKCGFANLIGGVFVVDLEDTYIFENKEELIKMKCEFVKKQSTNKD